MNSITRDNVTYVLSLAGAFVFRCSRQPVHKRRFHATRCGPPSAADLNLTVSFAHGSTGPGSVHLGTFTLSHDRVTPPRYGLVSCFLTMPRRLGSLRLAGIAVAPECRMRALWRRPSALHQTRVAARPGALRGAKAQRATRRSAKEFGRLSKPERFPIAIPPAR